MKHFEDSVEATEFMQDILGMINDERLTEWVVSTDENYCTSSLPKLEKIRKLYNQVWEEMTTAD